MSSPFSKQYMGKSPIAALTQQQEAKLPENLKLAIEAKGAGSPVKQEAVDLGTVKSDYKGKEKKLPFPGKEMYEGKGDYAQYKGKYTKDMLDMNANYTYQHNKANKPGYVEGKKRQMEAEGLSPLDQVSMDVSSKKLKKKTAKKELPQATKDSLQGVALKRKKPFYSKKHKVYVEGEDGVLSRPPVDPSGYEKI